MAEHHTLRESGLLGDRYLLVSPLGKGGMATVWRARDKRLNREVAVKVLDERLARNPESVARLHIEAQALARLSHPHITTVFDVGTAGSDQRTVYLVMELVQGMPLSKLEARLPWPAATALIAQVADALATAHAQGMVHRDVTAANVLLTEQGAKLIDFGICAVSGDNDTAHDGRIMGTTAYLAPERLDGKPVSPAVDVYAIGVLLHLLLVGDLPWDRLSPSNPDISLVPHRPALSSLDVPGLPPGVSGICLRCLEERPWRRPTAEQVADVLKGFTVPGKEMWKPVLASTRVNEPLPPTFTGPTVVKKLRRQHRSRPVRHSRAAVGAISAAILACAVWAATNWSPPPGVPPQALGPAIAAPPAPAGSGCHVSFQVTDTGDGRVTATIDVVNLTDRPVEAGWRLRFTLPDGAQLDPSTQAAWLREGSAATSRPSLEPLLPGQPTRLEIGTTLHGQDMTPSDFWINGRPCSASVVTYSTATTTTVNVANNDPAKGNAQPAPGGGEGNDNSGGNGDDQGAKGKASGRRQGSTGRSLAAP